MVQSDAPKQLYYIPTIYGHNSVHTTPNASTPMDLRSIALLNTSYKIFARLVASRLRLQIQDITHLGQHRGVDENDHFQRAFFSITVDEPSIPIIRNAVTEVSVGSSCHGARQYHVAGDI